MVDRVGDGDLTEPFACEGPVPLDAVCDGEWPLIELESATFFGVEPFETLTNPFDVVCIPLSSGRILLSIRRLRFLSGLRFWPSTLGLVPSTSSGPVPFKSVVNESLGAMGDEWRRRRRELRVLERCAAGADCGGFVESDDNTATRIEGVEWGEEWSVLVDSSARSGMAGWSVVEGVLFVMFSSARSTERQSRWTWQE